MNPEEENVRKRLEELFEKAEKSRDFPDIHELKLTLDDYLDKGYNVKDYMRRYIHEFVNQA